MRYYVYASDMKIDMLYSQIPRKWLKRTVEELGLTLTELDVSLKRRETEATLFGKLNVVEHFIERDFNVGSVAEHRAWFRGEMPLRWGVHGGSDGGLLFFCGLQDGVLVALIGSAHHQIGHDRNPATISIGYSNAPSLFAVLAREEPDAPKVRSHPDDSRARWNDSRALWEVRDFANNLTGVRQPCEFLARRLLHEPVADDSGPVRHIVLATPLYVALTDA